MLITALLIGGWWGLIPPPPQVQANGTVQTVYLPAPEFPNLSSTKIEVDLVSETVTCEGITSENVTVNVINPVETKQPEYITRTVVKETIKEVENPFIDKFISKFISLESQGVITKTAKHPEKINLARN